MQDKLSALVAYTVSAVILGVTLWPVFREPQVDSFPHSNYPMFSRKKKREVRQAFVRAKMADGTFKSIPPTMIANEEVLQAAATVRRAVRSRKRSRILCAEVAAKAAGEADFAQAARIELVTGTYDAISYFEGQTEPIRTKIHTHCKVKKGAK